MTDTDEQVSQLRLELRRGIVVLAVLSQMDTARYGYSLIQRLAGMGLEIEEGTLYPLLRRLEKQGLLESEWEMGEARPRKYYRISQPGREVLAVLSAEWFEMAEMMRRILGERIMTELVERYVHQVGRYLPPKERAEIEAELRSQIQDQLDDRFAGSPSPEQVATVLSEFGHPYMIAASYSSEKYLVGPILYPYMMLVLRRGWLIIPAIVVFLSIFGALVSPEPRHLLNLLVETGIAAVQSVLIFSALVVLFFALIQHSVLKIDASEEAFNPLDLPEVGDPGAVDRFEELFGVVAGTFVVLVFLYFLRVGGLTLRFDLSNPGEVIPFPVAWMILLIIAGIGQIVTVLLALRARRWNAATWLTQTVLEVFGTIGFYFAVTRPLFDRIIVDNPTLVFLDKAPEIFAVGYAVITLASRGSRLVRLWNYTSSTTPFPTR